MQLRARVYPAGAGGRASVTVLAGGREVGRSEVPVRGGVVAARVPLAAVGPLVLRVRLAARPGQAAAQTSVRAYTSVHTLAAGAQGADVLALRGRLAELGFHVPEPSTSFGPQLADAVIAFQKARGLDRTGRVDETVWRALGVDAPPRPRHTTPSPHIEIDKGRQLLLVVEDGRLAGALPVSSGATGNTPVGSFSILWKAAATSTWLGSAILYRTMTFYRNFAIHGYYSVPAYPASHGCVRVPIWAADWLYDRSHVGERVFVY